MQQIGIVISGMLDSEMFHSEQWTIPQRGKET